jgi:hypothetical protein
MERMERMERMEEGDKRRATMMVPCLLTALLNRLEVLFPLEDGFLHQSPIPGFLQLPFQYRKKCAMVPFIDKTVCIT